VLEYRRRREDHLRQELASARATEQRARERLSNLNCAFYESTRDMAGVQRSQIDVAEVNACHNYLARLKEAIAHQADLVTRLHSRSEEKRSEAVDGMKARKVVEKLKERSLEQYMTECKHTEQRNNDELATMRYKGAPGGGNPMVR
jgi:flagellar FliJ protein